jgi:hypothetical protein
MSGASSVLLAGAGVQGNLAAEGLTDTTEAEKENIFTLKK